MKLPLRLLIAGGLVLSLFNSARAATGLAKVRMASGQTMEAVPNQVIVRYRSGGGPTGSALARKLGIQTVAVPAGESIESFLRRLERDPNVEFVEPNGILRAIHHDDPDPNDTQFPNQYYLQSTKINIERAWHFSEGSSSIVVAVVDTGITLTHSDLDDNLWTNPNPSGFSGLRGTQIEIDFNGNSNCMDQNSGTGLGPDQCDSATPNDDNTGTFHGTHVAGIIAAETNNAQDMAGIARGCRMMAVKVLNSLGVGTFEAIAEGIVYAADNGAAVINLSLGGSDASQAVTAAINYALARNVVVVAASGNSADNDNGLPAPVLFPASLDRVIAVGATTASDGLAGFSCTGASLDLVAPGIDILSTTNDGTPANGGTDGQLDGTSFSAPMVAGVAALIRSITPSLPVNDVTRYIDFYADDLGAVGFDNSFGFGRLNAFRTLQAASTGAPFVSNPADPNETFPYPNPFRPSEGIPITFALPTALGTSDIKIEIHNLAGERIKTLNGTNVWDGKNDDGNTIASGFYIYFAKTSQGDAKGKLTVIK